MSADKDEIDIFKQNTPHKPKLHQYPQQQQQVPQHTAIDVEDSAEKSASGLATSLKANKFLIFAVIIVIFIIIIIAFFIYNGKENIKKFLNKGSPPEPQREQNNSNTNNMSRYQTYNRILDDNLDTQTAEHLAENQDDEKYRYPRQQQQTQPRQPQTQQRPPIPQRPLTDSQQTSVSALPQRLSPSQPKTPVLQPKTSGSQSKTPVLQPNTPVSQPKVSEVNSSKNSGSDLREGVYTFDDSDDRSPRKKDDKFINKKDDQISRFARGDNFLTTDGVIATELDRIESNKTIYEAIIISTVGDINEFTEDSHPADHNNSSRITMLENDSPVNEDQEDHVEENTERVEEIDTDQNNNAQAVFDQLLSTIDRDDQCIAHTLSGDRCKKKKVSEKFCAIHSKK